MTRLHLPLRHETRMHEVFFAFGVLEHKTGTSRTPRNIGVRPSVCAETPSEGGWLSWLS